MCAMGYKQRDLTATCFKIGSYISKLQYYCTFIGWLINLQTLEVGESREEFDG